MLMKNIISCCGNCKFGIAFLSDDIKKIHCRRFPPKITGFWIIPTYLNSNVEYSTDFPIVKPGWDCGEWKEDE